MRLDGLVLLLCVSGALSKMSDDFAFEYLMRHSREIRRKLLTLPESDDRRRLGATVTGSVAVSSCGTWKCQVSGQGSYTTHSLTYNSATGVFSGSITTK